MQENIINLTKKLIALKSTHLRADMLDEALEIARLELRNFEFTMFESEGTKSMLFSNQSSQTRNFRYILNAHLDVVEGNDDQFTPLVSDGKLFGRGAYDMKTAASIMIYLFKETADQLKYPLGLQITTDEEIGGKNGTGYQIEQGVRADFAITGEGTDFDIVHESKSRILIRLIARGKASHSAYPWLGDNAIHKMQKAVQRLHEHFPVPDSEFPGTTINITSISTENSSNNRTPDHCQAFIDARVIPGEYDGFLDKIKGIVTDAIDCDIVIKSGIHQSNPTGEHIKKLQELSKKVLGAEIKLRRAHGTSDARYFTTKGAEGIEFGLRGGNPHSTGEWADIRSIEQYYSILKSFLLA